MGRIKTMWNGVKSRDTMVLGVMGILVWASCVWAVEACEISAGAPGDAEYVFEEYYDVPLLLHKVRSGNWQALYDAIPDIKAGKMSVNSADEDGTTLLALAAQQGKVDEMCRLLDNGAAIEGSGLPGYSPLMWAVEADQNEAVRVLCDRGACVNVVDQDGHSVLFWAAFAGNEEVVKLLLAKKADTERANYNGTTPLIVAGQQGAGKIVELLVRVGA